MDRRDMLKKAAGILGLAVAPAAVPAVPALAAASPKTNGTVLKIRINEEPPPIRGIGVLRYPSINVRDEAGNETPCRDLAEAIASELVSGCILFLPNDRDCLGNYLWDFRIEAGNPSEIRVERSDKATS